MAQHGYLGDGWGARGDHGDEEFVRDWYDDRRGRERGGAMGPGRDWDRDRERSRWSERDRSRDWGDDDRSLIERARSWFTDDDDDDRRPDRGGARQYGFGGVEQRAGRRRFSSHPDDHYRSWRDKQIEALDRDYQDYCREREQAFHQEFDSWRQGRRSRQSGQPATLGESMSGQDASAASGELTLEASDRLAGRRAVQSRRARAPLDYGRRDEKPRRNLRRGQANRHMA